MNQKLLDISELLVNPQGYAIVTPTRKYIKEGELAHYDKAGKYKPGYFFLFNDLFMYTKKKGKNYVIKAFVTLDKAVIRYTNSYGN